MIRLLCINAKPVTHSNGICSTGHGLKEGKIYTADETIRIHHNNGKECYFIFELDDLKLTSRFLLASDKDESEFILFEEKEELVVA